MNSKYFESQTFHSLSVFIKPRKATHHWMKWSLCWVCYKIFIWAGSNYYGNFGFKKYCTGGWNVPAFGKFLKEFYRGKAWLERCEGKFVFHLPSSPFCKANLDASRFREVHKFFGKRSIKPYSCKWWTTMVSHLNNLPLGTPRSCTRTYNEREMKGKRCHFGYNYSIQSSLPKISWGRVKAKSLTTEKGVMIRCNKLTSVFASVCLAFGNDYGVN